MDKPWKVVFAFIGVFIAGAVFGGLFTLRASGKRVVESSPATSAPVQVQTTVPAKAPAGIAPALMRQFTQNIQPTKAQREKIGPLVNRAAEDLQRVRTLSRAQDRENLDTTTRIMERMYEDVAGLLRPEQRTALDEMRQKWQEKVAEERKKRGDPPGGDSTPRKTSPAKASPTTKAPASRNVEAKVAAPPSTAP